MAPNPSAMSTPQPTGSALTHHLGKDVVEIVVPYGMQRSSATCASWSVKRLRSGAVIPDEVKDL